MDNRYELAEQHGMTKEFVDWFFDEKKASLGEHWFLMMGAMWEGWKGSRDKFAIQLPTRKTVYASGYGNGYLVDCFPGEDGEALDYDEVIEVLTAAGITVKSD